MNNLNKTLATVKGRTLVYIVSYIIGAVIIETLIQIVRPQMYSDSSFVLTVFFLIGFVLVGALFVNQQHSRSRITSAATMAILGVIALTIGRHALPDPYLMGIALGVAYAGAQPILHRKSTSPQRTALYTLFAACVILVVVSVFLYGITIVDRLAAGL